MLRLRNLAACGAHRVRMLPLDQCAIFTILNMWSTRGVRMSKDPIGKGDPRVSRRGLLEKAALVVGAATSAAAARTALARSSDVVIDLRVGCSSTGPHFPRNDRKIVLLLSAIVTILRARIRRDAAAAQTLGAVIRRAALRPLPPVPWISNQRRSRVQK